MVMLSQNYDVFISGAGPVGLLLAFHLTRLGHSVCIVDAIDKGDPHFPIYGRASMLCPRTLEIFDQLDLYEDLAQVGFASDTSWGYKDGKVIDRRWGFSNAPESGMDTTFFNIILNIRLKYSEAILRRRLAELGVQVCAPTELIDFVLDETVGNDFRVTATCSMDPDSSDASSFQVKCRYIVGCDGGGSAVRRIAGIPFVGSRKLEYWVRVDGIVKTNVPEARHGLGAFESSTHGHVVWVSLDNGATRIGYVLSEELLRKYGTKLSIQDATFEARKAVAPFELEFVQVDWHTVYGIQQHVAERFQDRERVLIAGDAAHTHSSGSAQGMNTGIQDVANLSWKLSGALKGWWHPEVLRSYADERRDVALKLIENDKTISALVAGYKPEQLRHRLEHAHVLLDEVLRKNSGFTTGLTIQYKPNVLNDDRSCPLSSKSTSFGAARAGQRLPDALLQRSGIAVPKIRFYEVTRNNGKFRLLIFPGASNHTKDTICSLREQMDGYEPQIAHAVDLLTIMPGLWHAFDERLGTRRFGVGYWDPDLSAHRRWNVSELQGALMVLRPDGFLGLFAALGDLGRVINYLGRILDLQKSKSAANRSVRHAREDTCKQKRGHSTPRL